MGVKLEWTHANTTSITWVPPGEEAADHQEPELGGGALVLAGDDGLAIEGTPGEIRDLLDRAKKVVMANGRAGQKVRAQGVFAKGLKDGTVYTLRVSAPHNGNPTYEFVTSRGRVAARFTVYDVELFMLEGRRANDLNGLVPVAR